MASETRRLPVPLDLVSGKTRQEHLIPALDAHGGSGFVGIRSARVFEHALLAYTGVSVSAEALLNRFAERHAIPTPHATALARLTAFVEALGAFQLGNVLRVDYRADGGFELHRHAERPPHGKAPRLPG